MSAKEAPCANAWEEATLLVEWPLTPRGHCSPWDWYAKATVCTIQWANLCLETAFPFCCPPWQTKSYSELLTFRMRSTYMRNALMGHSNAKAGSASSEGSACRFTTWSWKGVVGTLGTYPGRESWTWVLTGPNTRHSSLTENAWRSPTRLMEVSTVRSAVLRDRNFSSTESSGSKGPLWSPARTIERSQEGTRGDLEGFILLAPFRSPTMRSCFPRDWPSTASWWAAIAATYTFKVEGDSLLSNPQISQSASQRSSARRETSTGGGRGCQSFHKGKARSQRNHAHTPTTGAWKRCDRPWYALLELALLVEVPRGIADERDSADRTVTPTRNKTKMKGFVEISTLLIHSAQKQKSNQWTQLLPFYTRVHGEWLRYAKSTSQFHWRFLLSQRWSGLPSKSPMSSRHNS